MIENSLFLVSEMLQKRTNENLMIHAINQINIILTFIINIVSYNGTRNSWRAQRDG